MHGPVFHKHNFSLQNMCYKEVDCNAVSEFGVCYIHRDYRNLWLVIDVKY